MDFMSQLDGLGSERRGNNIVIERSLAKTVGGEGGESQLEGCGSRSSPASNTRVARPV